MAGSTILPAGVFNVFYPAYLYGVGYSVGLLFVLRFPRACGCGCLVGSIGFSWLHDDTVRPNRPLVMRHGQQCTVCALGLS